MNGLVFFTNQRYAVVSGYNGTEATLVIPETYMGVPVTEIAEQVFAGCLELRHVVLPQTIRDIGDMAFALCGNLEFAGYLPEQEEGFPFEEAPQPSRFPPCLTRIGKQAFRGTALVGAEFSSPQLTLDDRVFAGCKALRRVDIPGCRALELGTGVFESSGLRSFRAAETRLDYLPGYTFANCRELKDVWLRFSAIDTRGFYNCESLESYHMPTVPRPIGRDAFTGCLSLPDPMKPKPRKPRRPAVPDPEQEEPEKFELPFPDPEPFHRPLPVFSPPLPTPPPEVPESEPETPMLVPETENRDPLFRLTIDYKGRSPKAIPMRIKGILHMQADLLSFTLQSPSSLENVGFWQAVDGTCRSLRPLLEHLGEAPVALLGLQQGEHYLVFDIDPPTALSGKPLNRDLFRILLSQLRRPLPEDVDLNADPFPYTIRGEHMDTYMDLCKHRLPSWVVKAYNRNKALALASAFRDDAKKHAQRAQELLVNIDWLPHKLDIPPAAQIRQILDQAFYGLEEVKQRILEVVAQIRRTNTIPKWGILLCGQAGVGKTTIARATAAAMDLPLSHLSLPGVGKDAEQLTGSSRIYSNAVEGKILSDMFNCRSSAMALQMDEAEKGHEAIQATLLNILDKTGFYENFLEETVPTDNIFCIATCNSLDKISKPLLDRFLVIEVPAYTMEEKRVIWQEFVLPKILRKNSISPEKLRFTEEAVDKLLSQYALEPGARDLEKFAERFVGRYCLEADSAPELDMVCSDRDVCSLLGPGKRVERSFALHPGEANFIYSHDGQCHIGMLEALVLPGTGKLEILGPMPAMQKEYCKVAWLCIRNTVDADLSKVDITLFSPQALPDTQANHVGMACYAAICSRLTGTNLALKDICFAGGVDLNGSVYFDSNNISPLLRHMYDNQLSALYAPAGASSRTDNRPAPDTVILEARDARTLFALATAHTGNSR